MTGLLFIAAAVGLIYSRSLHGEFIADDQCILDMEELYGKFSAGKYRLTLQSIRWPRSLTHWGYYQTWRISGLQPWGFHLGNVGIHLVNTLLVFRLGVIFGYSVDKILLVSAVFALHPLQVSAVSWISGRAGIQSAMFGVAGWVLLLTGFWPLSIVAQVLAQKSKEDAWGYLIAWPVLMFFVSSSTT